MSNELPKTLPYSLGLGELRQANISRDAQWCDGRTLPLSFRGNELAGEVGEACNIIKKLEREEFGMPGSRANKAQLAEELADVIICVDLLAMQLGINLTEAVRDKFNATSEKYGLLQGLGDGTPRSTEGPWWSCWLGLNWYESTCHRSTAQPAGAKAR